MLKQLHFAVVGAGWSGAVLANELAKAGHWVSVFDGRSHVGGNCFTQRDKPTDVMHHVYGPHIFHTNNESIWNYVNALGKMMPYVHRVKTTAGGRVYSLPINLHTLNQFFGRAMNPREAKAWVAALAERGFEHPQNFEEQGLSLVGRDLYQTFLQGYTQKQWGCAAKDLPASILKRLPLRFNYDDNYYHHAFQGIPLMGYTPMFEKLIDHPHIQTHLNSLFTSKDSVEFDHVFWTGQLDAWFDFDMGFLPYRTLDFVLERHDGDYQGCAVMNYADEQVPFTRISEYAHFTPWEQPGSSLIVKEFSRAWQLGDIPYYPLHLAHGNALLKAYQRRAEALTGVSFLGRLGSFRYLDMDQAIAEALDASAWVLQAVAKNQPIGAFFTGSNSG